jgi:hypothetical protein
MSLENTVGIPTLKLNDGRKMPMLGLDTDRVNSMNYKPPF